MTEAYDEALSTVNEAIEQLVSAINERDGTDYMLNKWYLAGQCVMLSDQTLSVNFGEPSTNCPLSDQLGMLDYAHTRLRQRIGEDDDE